MLVRLTRKFADRINGIDLRNRAVGDVVDLPDAQALGLVAEGWAVVFELSTERRDAALESVAPAPVSRRRRFRKSR